MIAGACGAEDALIEEKLRRGEASEHGGSTKTGTEREEIAGAAFAAGERDVRPVWARFVDEAAGGGGAGDALLESEQLGGGGYTSAEDSGAVKEAQTINEQGDRRKTEFAETIGNADELHGSGGAEELKGDVPGFRSRPTETTGMDAQTRADGLEFGGHRGGNGKADEEPHRKMVRQTDELVLIGVAKEVNCGEAKREPTGTNWLLR